MLLATVSFAKTIKVAVIDTGFDTKSKWLDYQKHGIQRLPKLCDESLHRNFSNDFWITDINGHGTHITGIIGDRVNPNIDYCIIIIKYYGMHDGNNQQNMNLAIEYAIKLKVDIINISGGGVEPDTKEKELIMQGLNNGIKIVAAAGNEGKLMNTKQSCVYFPACYSSKVISVSNVLSPISNRGIMVKSMQNGNDVKSIYLNNQYALMTGTSQSTAIQTAKIINEMGTHGK